MRRRRAPSPTPWSGSPKRSAGRSPSSAWAARSRRRPRRAGSPFVTEAFLDRGYLADGSLVPRDRPGALLDDPEAVAERALLLAREGFVRDIDGRSDRRRRGIPVPARRLARAPSRWPARCGRRSTRGHRGARAVVSVRVLPMGDRALLLEVAGLDEVLALHAALEALGPRASIDIVPAARTVLVRVDPRALPLAAARAWAAVGGRGDDGRRRARRPTRSCSTSSTTAPISPRPRSCSGSRPTSSPHGTRLRAGRWRSPASPRASATS